MFCSASEGSVTRSQAARARLRSGNEQNEHGGGRKQFRNSVCSLLCSLAFLLSCKCYLFSAYVIVFSRWKVTVIYLNACMSSSYCSCQLDFPRVVKLCPKHGLPKKYKHKLMSISAPKVLENMQKSAKF